MASLFKDFYKPVKNLLEKEYADNSISFGAKGKSSQNGKLEFESARDADAFTGSIKYDVKLPIDAADVNASVKIHSDGNVQDEVTVEDKKSGIKAVISGALESKDRPILENPKDEAKVIRNNVGVDVTYSHKNFKGTVGLAARKHTPLKVNVSGAGYYEGFSLGGDAVLHPQDKEKLNNYNLGFSHKLDNTSFALLVEKKLGSAKLGVAHKFSSDLSGGAEFKYDFKKKTNEFTVGADVKLDKETRVKAKINSDTTTTVALLVKLNEHVDANATVVTKLSELKDGKGSSTVSVGFEYEQ